MRTKIFFILLVAFLLFSIIVPKPVFAQLSIFEPFSAAMDGIEELSGPISTFLVKILFLYIFGLLALYTSTAVLEMAMNPDWITLQGNPLVEYGWQFSVNVASMFLILMLIVIALSIILKIGTFDAKKSLARLIVVALLINFTLLFVGALLDMSNVLQNTFIAGNADLPSKVIEGLGASGVGMLTNLIAWMVVLAAAFVIPFTGPFAQLAITTGLIVMFPSLITWAFQIACFFLISGIFFTYAVLFAARVFVIQVLAILSPLAFLAYIFPQTKKYADQWFKFLLEWVLLGISLFFFMSLGLAAAEGLLPVAGPVPIPIFGWGDIGGYVIYYLFLTIFLGVSAKLSMMLAPPAANQIIGMATAGVGIAIAGGAKISKKVRKKSSSFAASQEKKEEDARKGIRKPLTRLERAKVGLSKPIKYAHRISGVTPGSLVKKDVEEKQKSFEQRFGNDPEEARKYLGKQYKNLSREDKSAFALYAANAKGGKGLSRLSDQELIEATEITADINPSKIKDIVKHKPELLTPDKLEGLKNLSEPEQERYAKKVDFIKNRMVEPDDKDFQSYKKDIREKEKGLSDEEVSEKALTQAALKKSVLALKGSDIEKLDTSTLENEGFQEMVAMFKPWGSFIKKIGDEKGLNYTLDIQNKVEAIGIKEVAKTNPSFLKAAYSPGGEVFLRPWKDKGGNEQKKADIEKIIKGVNKSRQEDMKKSRSETPQESKKTGKQHREEGKAFTPWQAYKNKKNKE